MSVRVVGANGSDVSKVEFLDPGRSVSYFHEMVEYFVDIGYVRDVSIRGAPYDWRFAAGIYVIGTCSHACTCKRLVYKPIQF